MNIIETKQYVDDTWLITAEQAEDMSVNVTIVVEGRKIFDVTLNFDDWKYLMPKITNLLEEL